MPYLVKLEGRQIWQGSKLFTASVPSLVWERDDYRAQAIAYVASCSGLLP